MLNNLVITQYFVKTILENENEYNI